MRSARAAVVAAFFVTGAVHPSSAAPGELAGCLYASPVDATPLHGRTAVYVAPDGRDEWSGRLPAPAADGSDGPLASLPAARDAARLAGGPAAIVMRGGDYFLSAPVEFDGRDAGLAIVAAPGESPVLHGGLPLDGWSRDADGRWWAPFVPPPGVWPRALAVDGQRQVLARYPDVGPESGPRDGWLFAAAPAPGVPGNRQFRARPADIPAIGDLAGLGVGIVGGLFPGTQWSNDTLPVTAIDTVTGAVTMGGTEYFFTAEGSRYYFYGARALWDAPGEWWYDGAVGRMGYIPLQPDLAPANAVVGLVPTLFRLVGAHDVLVAGLTFRDGTPQGTGGFETGKLGGGGVRIEGSSGVRIIGNRFENLGVGVHVAESEGALVACNVLSHIAGNGIYVGTAWGSFGRSDDVSVLGNDIRDAGELYIDAAGIWFQAADRIRIADNRVENVPQAGIVGGSVWGPQDASHEATIEGNSVVGANRRTADGGAIKLMGAQADPMHSLIRGNLVVGTDELMNRPDGSFFPAHYENTEEWPGPISWAIYLDGRASGVTISGNTLVDNVAGVGINGGWSNLVTGNVITGGYGSAFRIDDATGRGWHPEWAEANRVEGNVVTTERRPGRVVEVNAPDHGDGYVRFARNLYAGPLDERSFRYSPGMGLLGRQTGDLDAFQKAGQEEGGRSVSFAPAEPIQR